MTLSRQDVEAVIIRRCGKKLAVAKLDVSTSGSNGDLNDPIGSALRYMGYSVGSIANVADTDLSAVPAEEVDELLDRVELRTMESIASNLDLVNFSVGPRSESLGQLHDQVFKTIERLQEKIDKQYGSRGGELEGGTISLDFQEKD